MTLAGLNLLWMTTPWQLYSSSFSFILIQGVVSQSWPGICYVVEENDLGYMYGSPVSPLKVLGLQLCTYF